MITKKRLIANSGSGLLERFVNLFVQLWLYQYLIKRISPEEYSLLPVVTALLVFIPPLLVVLTSGLTRDTVEADTRNDDRRVTEITSTIFPVLAATGIALAALAIVAAKFLNVLLKIPAGGLSEARLMVLLLFGSVSLRLILMPFGVGLYVRQKFVILNGLTIAQTIVRVALLFVLLFGAGPRVLWVVVATVAADVTVNCVTTILSLRALPAARFRFGCIRWELLPDLLSFGFWNMIGSIGSTIRKSSDMLILNWFATPIDINTFQLASLTDNQIDSVLSKVTEPLVPHMVAAYTMGGPKALRAIFNRVGCYSVWATLLVATPLIVFRHELWSLYLGAKLAVYANVPIVMVLLLARYWIEMPIYMVGGAAYAMNRVRALSVIIIAYSLTNVATTIYFVRSLRMGAIGSASGTMVAVVIWSLFVTWKFSLDLLEIKFWPWFRMVVWRGGLPSIIAGIFAVAWRYVFAPETIIALLAAILAVTFVYLLSIWLFCLDEIEHRQLKAAFASVSSLGMDGMAVSKIKSLIS